MVRLRLALTKGETVRYISHLDYAKTMERALRRSRLPVAYSEGFNPHQKISFASALAVGVTSSAEYLDLELTEEVPLNQVKQDLESNLGEGIQLVGAAYIEGHSPALMAVINLASYKIKVLLDKENPGASSETADNCLKNFNSSDSIPYVKETPKGVRKVDLKDYLAREVTVSKKLDGQNNNYLILEVFIKITPQGSVKPTDILSALINNFQFPVRSCSALIERTGLYIEKDNILLTPLEFGLTKKGAL